MAIGGGIDRSMDQIKVAADDANRDEEVRNWFKQVNQYARKVLLQSGYVLEPACDSEGSGIHENGRRFYDDKYRGHFDNLFRVCSLFLVVKGVHLTLAFRPLVNGSSGWAKTL